ncbi:hypothetical protein AYI70_g12217 [Smittium culicis]|uniref:Uncharacterized protein n=1 Tax=Smittium culicis TaxID=133412 RepID=A0A1R1WYD3_9FUNG|nr:hypothetical protein AYI70_g12217 [Smittium culicis]
MSETCKSAWWINFFSFRSYSTSVNHRFHTRIKSQLPREYTAFKTFEPDEIDLEIEPGQCVSVSYEFTDITTEAVGECCSALFFRSCKDERTVFKYPSSFAEITVRELVGCGDNKYFNGRILSRTPIIASEYDSIYSPNVKMDNSKNIFKTSQRHKPHFLPSMELNKSINGITAKYVWDITILKTKESNVNAIFD